MNTTTPLLVLDKPWEQAILLVTKKLAQAGLQTVRTFDLRDARLAHTDCTCPYHGAQPCDCQMVILLVYGEGQPVSLVAHGYEGKTWLALVETAQPIANPRLEMIIHTTLTQPVALYE